MRFSWIDTRRTRLGAAAAARAATTHPDVGMVRTSAGAVRLRDSRDDRPAVVLACDPPNVVEKYDAVFDLLSPDRRVICVELPGFGFSRPAPRFDFRPGTYAAVVEELADGLGLTSVTLAFPCVWSYTALHVASRRPELVRSLVLIQAPGWAEETAWARRIDPLGVIRTPVVGQIAMAWAPRQVARRWYDAASPPGFPVETLSGPALAALGRGAVFCLASLTQAWFDGAAPGLAPVECPAAIMWGAADRTHRRSTPQSAIGYVPNSVVQTFDDGGHFPELEDPTRLAAALTAVDAR